MKWSDFVDSVPELATPGEGLLRSTGLCLIGTIRADGSPRISPCEVILEEGELMLGMMWRSRKALDLRRDPRLVVHSTQCDREGSSGDFKAYGWAQEIPDDGADPSRPRPSHLFAVDITSAAYVTFGKDGTVLRWDATGGLQNLGHPGTQ